MNCENVNYLLIEYLYGELSPDLKTQINDHRRKCPACAAELASFQHLRQLMATLPEPDPSLMTINRIKAYAREEVEKPAGFWSWRWVKALAGVCVAVLVISTIIYQVDFGIFTPKIARTTSSQVASTPEGSPAGRSLNVSSKERLLTASQPAAKVEAPAESEPGPGTEVRQLALNHHRPAIPHPAVSEPAPAPAESYTLARSRSPLSGLQFRAATLSVQDGASAQKCFSMSWAEIKTTRSKPTSLSVGINAGQNALESGEFYLAAKLFQRVLNKLPDEHFLRPLTMMDLARAYEGLGERKKAKSVYHTLAMQSPVHEDMARRKIEELSNY